MFAKTVLSRSLALAFGGSAIAIALLPGAQAQTPAPQQKLERVTVTGSNIRRTDTETVAPVQVITREQIERSGRVTLADVVKDLPSNTGGSFNEYANSFAPGSSGASLRGLGQKATLVLLNGRRLAGYGFAQNIQDSFVDLNSIPASAIERIEVLRDGASAIYGSDAIAGVINIILRKDYKGAEVAALGGYSKASKDYRASFTGGIGDLASDRYNAMVVLDIYHRGKTQMSDTEFASSRDQRGKDGGRNFQSLTGGGTWRNVSRITGGAPNLSDALGGTIFRATADCQDPITFAQAAAAGLLTPQQQQLWNQPGNTFCRQDYSNVFTLLPETSRLGLISRGTLDVAPNLQLYGELGYSRNETKFNFQQPFFAGTTALYQPTPGGQLAQFPYNVIFAPGAAGNPLPTNATYSGVFQDLGTRDQKITADQGRLLVGAKYSFGTFDFDSGASYARSSVTQESRIATKSGVSAALGVPTDRQPPTPVSNGGPYNLDRFSTNSQALRDSIMLTNPRESKSQLYSVDTKMNTTLASLPGGDLGLAVGVELRRETIRDRPTTLATSGGILGQGAVNVDGARNVAAAFTELGAPVFSWLEGQAAVRIDRYSDYGSSVTPKLGLKIKPIQELLIRANWGRGFRAPSLPEISDSTAFFFTTVTNPINQQRVQVGGAIQSNPDLKPEKSRSFNFGIVFEPLPDLSFDIDYYDIKWVNQIVFEDFQAIVDKVPLDPRVLRDAQGNPLAVTGGYVNAAEVKTNGIDIGAQYRIKTEFGRFSPRLTASYLASYKYDDGEGFNAEFAGTNRASNFINANSLPHWKGQLALDYDQGPLSATVQVNYLDGYNRQVGAASFYTGVTGNTIIPQTGVESRRAPSYATYDAFLSYKVTKDFKVSGSVINIGNKFPPFDPAFNSTYFFDRTQYDARGRIFRLGASYSFF